VKKQKIKNETKPQKALDEFPKVVKAKEKAAQEKKRIMKNFASVKKSVYR